MPTAPLLILFGISAVGKTTASQAITLRYPEVLSFQASSLLKSALAQSGEALRTASEDQIAINQVALNAALTAARLGFEDRPAVLDAHSVIDNDRTLVEVPLETFTPLRPQGVAMLTASPEIIVERRKMGDRVRPERSIEELARHQTEAEAVARSHALALLTPFATFDSSDHQGLIEFAASVLKLSMP